MFGSLIIFVLNIVDRILFYFLYLIRGEKLLVHDMRKRNRSAAKKLSEPVTEKRDGESPVYRNAKYKDRLLMTPLPEAKSVCDVFDHVVKEHGAKKCMGWRKMIKMHTEELKQKDGTVKHWEIPEFAPLKWQSFSEIGKRTDHITSGLLAFTGLKSGEKLAMFENTCYQWMLLAQACFRYSIIVSTVYANLGIDALITALQETEATTIFTNVSTLKEFEHIAKECKNLKYVIYTRNGIVEDDEDNLKKENILLNGLREKTQLKFISFDELEELGRAEPKEVDHSKAPQRPTIDSLALIMYTSGTTGKPKGVMLSHKNMLSSMASVDLTIGEDKSIEYRYIAYLPLAHILELVAEHVILLRGGCIGYGSARTLTEKGARPIGDIQAIAPSALVGVPRVFDTIKKGALERIESGNAIARFLFNAAYQAKLAALYNDRETPLWNALVFNKFRRMIGGNIALMLSGGAPLNKDSQLFMRVCFGCCFIQGYGLTETSATVALQGGFDRFEVQSVGAPLPSSEIKLVDVPEMGYLSTDKPYPRGEIVVRGNNISTGYFKHDSLTKEVFTKDGWFYTGDIGQIKDNGALQIIDRRKNLVKLSGGEYISLETLESIYGNSKYVTPNGIMVYAKSEMDKPVAVILPSFAALRTWARNNGISSLKKNDLIHNEAVIAEVLRSLEEEGKKNKVQSFEKLLGIKLYNEEWTVENGCLTAAMKLKRGHIYDIHKEDIETMFNMKQ